MPKISVIMPAYNAEKYIGEAIESILNQTFTDFELIVINDGSADKTKDIILSYTDSRIVYLENEKNSGIVVTLNKGIDIATGEYIARMDSDDISLPTRFERQIAFMDTHTEIGVLGTAIKTFGESVQEQTRIFSTKPNKLKADLLFSTNIAHPSVMMRKSVLDKHNIRYDLEYAGAEDFLMWWNLSQKTQIATLPEVLLNYRIHKSQITHDKGEKYRALIDKMLTRRLDDIHYTTTPQGRSAMLQYCLGDYDKFSSDTLRDFIDILSGIIKQNKSTAFFDTKSLKNVCSLAVIYSVNQSQFNKIDVNDAFKYATKKGLFTAMIILKNIYHKIF